MDERVREAIEALKIEIETREEAKKKGLYGTFFPRTEHLQTLISLAEEQEKKTPSREDLERIFDKFETCGKEELKLMFTIEHRDKVITALLNLLKGGEGRMTQREQVRKVLEDIFTKEFGELKIKPDIQPKHGSCCTCQICGYHYDDCNCRIREAIKEIDQATDRIMEIFADKPRIDGKDGR